MLQTIAGAHTWPPGNSMSCETCRRTWFSHLSVHLVEEKERTRSRPNFGGGNLKLAWEPRERRIRQVTPTSSSLRGAVMPSHAGRMESEGAPKMYRGTTCTGLRQDRNTAAAPHCEASLAMSMPGACKHTCHAGACTLVWQPQLNHVGLSCRQVCTMSMSASSWHTCTGTDNVL